MQSEPLTRSRLKTPRAAAIAGIAFSVLLIAAFGLLRVSVPADPHDAGAWLRGGTTTVAIALNLVPFAGIAFLWFIGVLRDRLGAAEDRFFGTVFLGSGLLYLAMLFCAAALAGAVILAFAARPREVIDSAMFHFARAAVYDLVNIYMTKMACIFMISTSTVAIRTGFAPYWLALTGYAMAALLLLGSYYVSWGFVVFPLWVLVTSIHILVDNVWRSPSEPRAAGDE